MLPSKIASSTRLALAEMLQAQPALEFAVLVGSRATGTAQADSDWDLALKWGHELDWLETVARTEQLRRALARVLAVDESRVDLIDLRRANLAMRASVAEEGIPLAGEDGLAWMHFLLRTWRELEDFYWERQHAA
jgi:predicted nucleotidyltransferase